MSFENKRRGMIDDFNKRGCPAPITCVYRNLKAVHEQAAVHGEQSEGASVEAVETTENESLHESRN